MRGERPRHLSRARSETQKDAMSVTQSPSAPNVPDAQPPSSRIRIDGAIVRFAGDSGDGMQLTGSQFSTEAALAGNDLATFPDLDRKSVV